MKSGEQRADPRSPIPELGLDRPIEELINWLKRLARSRVPPGEVDDVVGDTLLDYVFACMEKAATGETVRNPQALATTILVRQAGRHLRRRKRSRLLPMDCDTLGVVDEMKSEAVDARGVVKLGRLGRRQRALIQGVVAGRSLSEIAEQLGERVTVAELARVAAELVRRMRK